GFIHHIKTFAVALTAAFGVVAVGKVVSGITAIITGVRALAASFAVLELSLAPLAAVGAAVAALAAGLGYLTVAAYKYATQESASLRIHKHTARVLQDMVKARKALTSATSASFPTAKQAALNARDSAQSSLIAARAMAIHTKAVLEQTRAQLEASKSYRSGPVGSAAGNRQQATQAMLSSRIKMQENALKSYKEEIDSVSAALKRFDHTIKTAVPKKAVVPSSPLPAVSSMGKTQPLSSSGVSAGKSYIDSV